MDTILGGEAAGDDTLFVTFVANDAGSPCRNKITTNYFFTAMRVRDLVRLQPRTGLVFGTISSDHSDLFYVAPGADSVVYAAIDNFFTRYGRNLTVTAAGLPFGGLQDIPFNWSTRNAAGVQIGHSTHRLGTDVDLDSGTDTQAEFRRIEWAGTTAGFPSCEVHGRNHVHCYYTEYVRR